MASGFRVVGLLILRVLKLGFLRILPGCSSSRVLGLTGFDFLVGRSMVKGWFGVWGFS